jgi:hypothetical protein
MEIEIEQSSEATFNLKDQISNILQAKKVFAISAIDELVNDIKREYESVLSQRESELRLSKTQEMEYTREIEHLVNRKNEILHSLEIETQSHKKTITNLIAKDKEISELSRANEELREKYKDEVAKNEAISDELAKRSLLIIELKEEMDKLKGDNSSLKDKADRLKTYTQKGSQAYANAQQIAENELLTKTIMQGSIKTDTLSLKDSNNESSTDEESELKDA